MALTTAVGCYECRTCGAFEHWPEWRPGVGERFHAQRRDADGLVSPAPLATVYVVVQAEPGRDLLARRDGDESGAVTSFGHFRYVFTPA